MSTAALSFATFLFAPPRTNEEPDETPSGRTETRPDASAPEESQSRQGLSQELVVSTCAPGTWFPARLRGSMKRESPTRRRWRTSGTIANDKIKAVVLTLDGRGPVELTKEKRERLLTLPRMQKDNPPTHLIRSCDGDYLRGRVVEMDDRKLVVEVRLQAKELPRDRISRIIWLHPDELPGTAATKKQTDAARRSRVQAVHDNGTRLTFHPKQFKDSILSGTSDALGPCRIGVWSRSTKLLLIGNAIEEAVTKTAYQQWKLQRYAGGTKIHRGGGQRGPQGFRLERVWNRHSSEKRRQTLSWTCSTGITFACRITKAKRSCSTSGPRGAAPAYKRFPTWRSSTTIPRPRE